MKNGKQTANNQPLFSLSFVYKDRKEAYTERPEHIHDFYEIIYVYEGYGVLFIDDAFYQMNPGDVFIVPAHTIHYAKPAEDNPVMSSVIFISPALIFTNMLEEPYSFLDLFEKIKQKRSYRLSLKAEQQYHIEALMDHIHHELTGNEAGSSQASLLLIHQIILKLYRIFLNENKQMTKRDRFSYSWIHDVFIYIDKHLSEKLTLANLARQALVSPAHLSRVFKETTGMGISVYINKKRIIKARELLLETDCTVNQAAEAAGFDSMPHFYRTFKKYIGTTPSKYRK